METILLIGAEDVRSAGYAMRVAAHEITRAVATLQETLTRQQQQLDEWLERLREVLAAPPGDTP